jgi:zinc protease
MAYYVGSGFEANVLEGPLQIRAGVAAGNVERAIASIDEELARLRRDGLTDKELQESRQWAVGSMPRALETNAGIANFLQTAEFFQLGADYDLRLPELLGRVTLEEASAAARALDPGCATIVVAGPTAASATPPVPPA